MPKTKQYRGSESDSSVDFSSTSGSSSDVEEVFADSCFKLQLPENLRAYIEKRELIRDIEAIPCESNLAEKVMSNYIIAKRVLGNVRWQDKSLCKHVCTTWRSAINALARERLNPVDFVYDFLKRPRSAKYRTFTKSENFYNEPLSVMMFINTTALNTAIDCKDLTPFPCRPPCEDKWHSVLDMINQQVCAPKKCMLTAVACALSYLPLPHSVTEIFSPPSPMRQAPLYTGIYIPVIPGVQFHVLNIKQRNKNAMDLKKDFYDIIDKLAEDQIIKGAIVFVTEKYILHSVEDIMLLNYLKQVQPDIPYALGGCIVEDTLSEEQEIVDLIDKINAREDYVTKNLISVALFSIPKNIDDSAQREKCNFEMFSLVIESVEWVKEKIKQTISEFSKKVPHFENSVALKLSCVGRDRKHLLEQDLFRAEFPQTPIIGCYGNGELGINHPPRTPVDTQHRQKRQKGDPGPQGLMYSYSTVFVYIGWGKIISPETST